MDSHIIRKAAARLPALADLAVLRFNTRGTTSPRGTSEGSFGDGVDERADVAAAMAFVAERGLPHPWLVGWSFGTELALKYGLEHPHRRCDPAVAAAAPHHRRTSSPRWHGAAPALVALVPEHDDYLRPAEAAERFACSRGCDASPSPAASTSGWGRSQTRRVLDEIVARGEPVGAAVADGVARDIRFADRLTGRGSALVLAGDHDLLDDQQDRRRRRGSR